MGYFSVPSVAFFYTRESYGEGLFQTVKDLAIAAGRSFSVQGVGIEYQPQTYDQQLAIDACQSIRDTGSKFVIMAMGI
eukprot:6156501-Amphidinium_carterae.1